MGMLDTWIDLDLLLDRCTYMHKLDTCVDLDMLYTCVDLKGQHV